ncbi:META domain-containing protein [Ensifer sp. 2YAB10]|uniref:META domain-containing protein n=1 Tax=Ensifer TaxID=106591 RepID=UPI001CBBF18A|nr:META domain-containing protein [Ensifer adhaerens]MBZ7923455.1 META domain-containing protein [Ensifer adhaerens]UAX92018.1 META domain-containing protein [Ensifer adhaerens]UAX99650.1 META domain-containing protein [Ensifer adhaerens]UAY07034.1 META domain-containing protein [Ensifer adhaerens]
MLKVITAVSCACVTIEMASMQPVAAEDVPQQLVGTWLAEDIGGGGVIDNLQSTLEIREDGTYGGMAGCNHFTGTFSLSGSKITFGPAAATRKMCVPAAMTQEQKFLEALRSELSWTVEGSKLVLDKPEGRTAIKLALMAAGSEGADVTFRVPGAGAVDRQSMRYDCGGKPVEAEYINAGPVSLVTFTIDGTFVVASNVISGSGAKYAGGQYIWWTKGDEATLFDATKGEGDQGIACKPAS